jgi:predicted aldo/keto reductase-like oxidoreductase
MQYRKMGSLDWKVSSLGFGCMRLPQRRINRLRAETDESVKIIRSGIDQGINYVDTAWPYHLGDSEKILGEALKNGYREKVKLVTKLPIMLMRNGNGFDNYLETQMKRLQAEYLDIYLMHGLDRGSFENAKRWGLFKKFEEAKEEGLINHIGFSFHDTLPVFKEIIDYYPWDMAQIQYNYMDTGFQATTEGLRYAHSKDIAVVIMEPLKGGKLANPPKEALDSMNESGIDRTPVDWALQFLWDKPEVSCVLSGMGSQQMVDENCDSADKSGIGSLSEIERATIQKVADIYREKILVQCTACNYCMPCPAGVDIPGNFALLNDVAMETSRMMRFMARRRYNSFENDSNKVDMEKPNGKASLCIKCGKCLSHCPQNIQIPDELEKVDAILGKRRRISNYY